MHGSLVTVPRAVPPDGVVFTKLVIKVSDPFNLMADRIRNSGGRVMHYAGDALLAVNFLAHGFAAGHGTNGRTCFATAIGITEL